MDMVMGNHVENGSRFSKKKVNWFKIIIQIFLIGPL